MMKFFEKELTRQQLMQHMGDISQLGGITESTLAGGRANGLSVAEFNTGTGLRFTVLKDRCMDIAQASYKGIPISYISKTGNVAPCFFEPAGDEFLRSFASGLLTTCGMTYMGAPGEDGGQALGLHGRVGNTPAQNTGVSQKWVGDEFCMDVWGEMKEAKVFGPNLSLNRKISARLGENKLTICDTVENIGFEEQPLMMLYHINFGWPLVSEASEIILDKASPSTARDEIAQSGYNEHMKLEPPQNGYQEQVFYHDIRPDEKGTCTVRLQNKELGFGVRMEFLKQQLPRLIEWKQMGQGDYVLGLEPSTNTPEGRAAARQAGELQMIKPFEKKEFQITLAIEDL